MKIWNGHINALWKTYLIDENAEDNNAAKNEFAKALFRPLSLWLPQCLKLQNMVTSVKKNDLDLDQTTTTICTEVIMALLSTKPAMENPDNYIFTLIRRFALQLIKDFEIRQEDSLEVSEYNLNQPYSQTELEILKEFEQIRLDKIKLFLGKKLSKPLSDYEIEVFFQRYLFYDTDFKEWISVADALNNSIDSVKKANQELKSKLNDDERNYTRLAKILRR